MSLINQIILKSRKVFIRKDQPSSVQSAAIIDEAVICRSKHIYIQICQIQLQNTHAAFIGLIKIDAFTFRDGIPARSLLLLTFLIAQMIGRTNLRNIIHLFCTKLNLHVGP